MPSSSTASDRVVFAGIEIDPLGLAESTQWILDHIHQDGFQYVVTPNAAHVVKIVEEYSRIYSLYQDADLCVNDSRIIQKVAARQGHELPVCPGSDLTANLLDELNKSQQTVCVVGGEAYFLPILHEKYKNLTFEQYIPPMGFIKSPDEIDKTLHFLKNAKASVFFFAVGMPQQEILAWKCAHETSLKGVGLCIGASIDFIIGTQKRAPKIWQDLSLEWLYRLLSDPKRLAKRYLVESPRMFHYAFKYKTVEQLRLDKEKSAS